MIGDFPHSLVIIGSSTGGPDTLRRIIKDLNLSATLLIVQHMPSYINESMIRTFREIANMPAELASDGSVLEPGTIYLCPGGQHLRLLMNRKIELSEDEPVNFVRPSIDVTMFSLQRISVQTLVGIVLTGLGEDGARGLCHMKNLGATTMAQAPESCVLDAMPKAAIGQCGVDFIYSPEMIRLKLVDWFGRY